MRDTFDEIASKILISDAELALTFVHLGNSRRDGESRRMAFARALRAYRSICESVCTVRMKKPDLEKLGQMLQELRDELDHAQVGQ